MYLLASKKQLFYILSLSALTLINFSFDVGYAQSLIERDQSGEPTIRAVQQAALKYSALCSRPSNVMDFPMY